MSSKSSLTEARNALASDLADALVRLKDKEEAMALLADLCTPAEDTSAVDGRLG